MSDFRECILQAGKDGDITGEERDDLLKAFDGYKNEFDGDTDAAARATYDQLEHEKARRLWHKKLTEEAQAALLEDIDAFRNGSGSQDVGEFLINIIEASGHVQRGVARSVKGQQHAIQAQALAMLEELTFKHRRGVGGYRKEKAGLDNVLKESFGEDTKDASAKVLAKSWADTSEWLRQQANKYGMEIGKLENWGMLQSHNPRAIRHFIDQHGKDAFKQKLYKMLNPAKMYNKKAGKAMTPEALWLALDDTIENIITDGWAARTPGMVKQGTSLANRRDYSRFLTFKDADTWLEYQREFGGGDVYGAMMGHVAEMSRDIAALKVLGPNPDAMIEFLQQSAQKSAGDAIAGKGAPLPKKKKPDNYVRDKIRRMDAMWADYTGAAGVVSGSETIATVGATVRNLLTAAHLGAAALASVSTDPMYNMYARRFTGLKGASTLNDYFKQLSSQDARREAQRLAVMNDSAMDVLGSQARYAAQIDSKGISGHIAQQTLAVSGLTAFTRAGRQGFGMAMYATFADVAGREFADLEPKLQRTLTRHGFVADDWNVIRRAKTGHVSGANLLTPEAIKAVGDPRSLDLADRFIEMMHVETDFAVPSGTLRSRTALFGSTRKGNAIGEVVASAAMFKSFPMAFWMSWAYRFYSEFAQGRGARSGSYMAAVIGSLTIGGGISWQLKEIAAGRDPLDMTTPDFWAGAALKGGALGVYADFVFAGLNEYGRSKSDFVAGPVVGAANDAFNLTVGNAVEVRDTNAGRELTRFVDAYTPGSNVWYIKAAFDRLIVDNLSRALDPDADDAFRNRQRYYQRERDQEYFWAPGENLPARAPEIEAAIGD